VGRPNWWIGLVKPGSVAALLAGLWGMVLLVGCGGAGSQGAGLGDADAAMLDAGDGKLDLLDSGLDKTGLDETDQDGPDSPWLWPSPLPEAAPELDLSRWNPRLFRPSEVSLDGQWLFAFDPEGDGLERGMHQPPYTQEKYDRTIEVPFPWSSLLSGVGPEPPESWAKFGSEREVQSYKGDAWYATEVPVPADFGPDEMLMLRFGAVDWKASVYVEGDEAGEFVGGFVDFQVDLTPWASGRSSINVALKVTDLCDGAPEALLGKQGGIWYTCAGGIWQTVTLERVAKAHIRTVITGMSNDGLTAVKIAVSPEAQGLDGLKVRLAARCLSAGCLGQCQDGAAEAEVEGGVATMTLDLSQVPVWTPESPCLLTFVAQLGARNTWLGPTGGDGTGADRAEANRTGGDQTEGDGTGVVLDEVHGYLARRELSIEWFPGHSPHEQGEADRQFKAIYAGKKPVYLRSVLDQGYHPLGILQYPSRDARKDDLLFIKSQGFNGLRQHIKPEGPWFYAMADLLGLWVVYDMPCPAQETASGAGAAWREPYVALMKHLVARDGGHPSILWWVLFNEAWGVANPPFWNNSEGQEFVRTLVATVKALDPGRPVEDHSPGGLSDFLSMGAFPHVESDLMSFHLYASDLGWMAKRLAEVVAGFAPGLTGHFFGGRVQGGEPLFNSEFGGLAADDTRGDGGYLLHAWLNELHRHEKLQGYVFTQAYDVEWEKNGLMTYYRDPKELGLEEMCLTLSDLTGDPYLVLGPNPIVEAAPGAPLQFELGISGSAPLALTSVDVELRSQGGTTVESLSRGAASCAAGYCGLEGLAMVAPGEPGVYVLTVQAHYEGGTVKNGLYLIVDQPEPLAPFELTSLSVGLSPEVTCIADAACQCAGWCDLDFLVVTPGPGRYRLVFEGELASFDPDVPQTDSLWRMTSLELRLNDEGVMGALIPDSPADHRGVVSLSRHQDALRGRYGFASTYDLGVHDVGETLTLTLRSHDNGVAVFFRDGGRFLNGPSLFFVAEE